MFKERQNHLSKLWLILLVTSLGVGMATIDSNIVNVALPILAKNFGVTILAIQWVVTGYLLMICVLLPLSGYLGDIFTPKVIYLSGFLIFTLSSILCGISVSLFSLEVCRVLQGVGGAMIVANNQVIILSNCPRAKRGRALSINAMVVAVGSIAGPGIGGVLIGLMGWRSIFFINAPIGILAIWLGYKILPKGVIKSGRNFDFLGALTFGTMMTFVVLILSNGVYWGWSSEKTLWTIVIAAIALLIFLINERKAKLPMVDLTLFRIRAFSSGTLVLLLMYMAMAANIILLPFYLDSELHLSPQMIGVILFVVPAFILVVSPLSGYLADHFNQAFITGIGAALLLIGLVIQSFLNSDCHIYHVIIGQSIIGCGVGLFNTPINYSILNCVPKEKMGIASGLSSLTRNLGKICGITIATTIFTTLDEWLELIFRDDAGQQLAVFTFGFQGALLIAAFFVFIAMILAFSRHKSLVGLHEDHEG